MTKTHVRVSSVLGQITLVQENGYITNLIQEKQPKPETIGTENPQDALLQQAAQELHEYLQGDREHFTVPFKLEGSPLQTKVWEALTKIPYGQTITYSQLANDIGNPKAFRAVATAVGKNKITIFVPCHRVTGKTNLGGYSGGLPNKEKLLTLEN